MDLEIYRTEMEQELTWRSNELRFLKNQMSTMNDENDKEKYRKSLVVMLYSHFEGFTKTCLQIYLKAINDQVLIRKDVNECIVAASMDQVFKKYEDKDRKCDIFRRSLPEDKHIHKIFRRTDMVIQFHEFLEEQVHLPDEIVDTESNLWYKILQKNLYKLGIDSESFANYESKIDELVNLRNSIAHGSERTGIKENRYQKLENSVYTTMNELLKLLMKNLRDQAFTSKLVT